MAISSEHGEQMRKELFRIPLPHGEKLTVAFARERFDSGRPEPGPPSARGMLWCRMNVSLEQ